MIQDTLTLVTPHGALFDYVMENAEDPHLFRNMPRREAKAALRPGMSVKVGLNPRPGSDLHPEHFWAEIVAPRGIAGFIGKVANDIQPGFGLKYGDLFIFCDHHIREIEA